MQAGSTFNQRSNPSHDHSDGEENALHSGRDGQNKKPKIHGATPSVQNNTGSDQQQTTMLYEPNAFVYRKGVKARDMFQQTLEQNEDVTMENDGTEDTEGGDANEEAEWHQVTRVSARYFTAYTKEDYLTGDTRDEKKRDLVCLLGKAELNITEGPFQVKIDDEPCLKVAVETETELQKMLAIGIDMPDEEGNDVRIHMFKRLDNTKRELEIERTLEVYGLHPRTHRDRIESALGRFGEIERITTRPCTRGVKITASVLFREKKATDGIRNAKLSAIFVGKDMARIRRIGTPELIEWDKTIVAKLTGLPNGTTPLDLSSLLGPDKATFITVPWAPTKGGTQSRRLNEAFVYFPSEEAKAAVTRMGVSFGETKKARWVGLEEKACHLCGEVDHLRKDCVISKEMKEQKAHIRAVKAFQKGKALQVVQGRSFSDIVRNTQEQTNTGSQQRGAVTFQETNKNTIGKEQKKDNKEDNELIKEMVAMNKRLEEANRAMMEQMNNMCQLFMGMMSTVFMSNGAGIGQQEDNSKKNSGKEKGKTVADLPPMGVMVTKLMQMCMEYQEKEKLTRQTRLDKTKLPGTPKHRMEPHLHTGSDE
ncbi:hypothetical protein EMPS_01761 [Entomortierella parvispora]|uniref:CCHC-type domain-containing protein n=1 Tax=Entomortierella parvispora TaxID=205924 RepID=A0A9P3LT96_9FUNG|nr:hypothetical protein EMPS_01761 [Entomortierella parvispora]